MHIILQVVLIAFVAGAVGTLLGGVLGIIVKKPTKSYIGYMLGFAAGAMLAVAIFELLDEAVEHGDYLFPGGGIVAVVVGLALGALFIFLLEPKKHNKTRNDELMDKTVNTDGLPSLLDKEQQERKKDQRKFKRLGIAVFIAIILHDFPEGLAIGVGAHTEAGIRAALVFGAVLLLHNIPEGLAIAVPLKASGMKTKKILGICFAAGLPTVLGAIIGYYMGYADWLLAFTFAFAAGVMLYVVLTEMLPTAYEYAKNKKLLSVFILLGAVILIVFATLLH